MFHKLAKIILILREDTFMLHEKIMGLCTLSVAFIFLMALKSPVRYSGVGTVEAWACIILAMG